MRLVAAVYNLAAEFVAADIAVGAVADIVAAEFVLATVAKLNRTSRKILRQASKERYISDNS
jgi:hypothetical protein